MHKVDQQAVMRLKHITLSNQEKRIAYPCVFLKPDFAAELPVPTQESQNDATQMEQWPSTAPYA